MKALTYVEIDQPRCSLVYGTSPCTAEVGVTGDAKCFNSKKTCQDLDNYDEELVTLRFAVDVDYLPKSIDAIASIVDWSVSPAIISLGEDLGLRAEMRVTLKDHPWPDTGAIGDKYLADRDYDPFTRGTFWGKWRARFQYLRGRSIRLIHGYVGQSLEEMETRHYIVESVSGLGSDGQITIIAKDPLKLLDGDRAQAPLPNNGFLVADVTDSAGSFTLAPTGVGAEYPASGFLNIGGSEIVAFTRSGDVITMTARGQLGTFAAAHSAQDRVQLVLRYDGDDPADIIRDLMVNYAGVPAGYINLVDWKAETTSFLRRVYSATIGDPESVKKLIVEIIQQAALSIWWDDVGQTIRLRVLRAIETDAEIIDQEIVQRGSFRTVEQPNKRVSQVWIYYGQRNPLTSLEDVDNFRSLAVTIDADAEANYGSPAIRKILSRWIALGGRTVALRVGEIILGRYKDPPRRFDFTLLRGVKDLIGGQGYRAGWWTLQDVTGAQTTAPIQITRVRPDAAEMAYEAEEQLFQIIDPEDLDNRTIIFDAATQNVNLRSVHDALYPAPLEDDDFTLTCFIETNVIVGATASTITAFDVGTWPAGIAITIINNGRIQGAGGKGGNVLAGSGAAGGLAFYTRKAVAFDNALGRIYGGGGGGAAGSIKESGKLAGGGGGGAGAFPGAAGTGSISPDFDGKPGTLDSGGAGGPSTSKAWPGGAGGGIATAGQNAGGGGVGGAAGRAVDGDSFVSFTAVGDIRGARIN
jgi:hypothetical protein